jgi:hypothetical protein
LGSQFAGLPSGNAGSHVVDHVIGVPDAPKWLRNSSAD